MSKAPKFQKSKGDRSPYHESKPVIVTRYTRFKDARGLDEKYKAANAITEVGGTHALSLGAFALVETACLDAEQNSVSQVELFARAEKITDRVLQTAKMSGKTTVDTFKAGQLGFDIPLLFPMYSLGVMPKLPAIQLHYQQTLRAVELAIQAKNEAYARKDMESVWGLNGHISEMAVRLLIQRDAIKENGDNSWLPMSSHLSEDWGKRPFAKLGPNPSWDISVFTQPDPGAPIVIRNKIQVKTTPYADKKQYEDGIMVITPEMLANPKEGNPNFHRYATELIAEVDGTLIGPRNIPASPNIDRRTKLLNSLLD